MARIRTYPLVEQADITADDYLLGNDLNDGSVITKRFSLEDVKDFVLGDDGENIRDLVPRSYTVGVNSSGTAISPVPVTTKFRNSTQRTTGEITTLTLDNPDDLIMDLTDSNPATGASGNGSYFIRTTDFELPYFLTTFIGATVAFTINGFNYTGTLGAFTSFSDSDYFTDSTGTHFYNYFVITLDDNNGFSGTSTIDQLVLTPGNNGVVFYLLELLADVDIAGNLTTGNRVDVGTQGDNTAELHVQNVSLTLATVEDCRKKQGDGTVGTRAVVS